jgi:N-methylhydantoinase B/oxoprolinase/acetone carboxylase alpha subunit
MSVRAAIDHQSMQPGDIVMLNDPFRGGTHLPDITLVSPIFLPGKKKLGAPGLASETWDAKKPSFYVANRAHHSDVGGMTPGSMPLAREIFQEGLIIPPVKLVSRGTLNSDIMAMLLANVRTPDEREGDLTAQIAANRVGEISLLDIAARYGPRPRRPPRRRRAGLRRARPP